MTADDDASTTRLVEVVLEEIAVARFAELSGDTNPLHIDERAARKLGHPRRIAHGVLSLFLLARPIRELVRDGPPLVWRRSAIRWTEPVFVGHRIRCRLRARRTSSGRVVDIEAHDEHGRLVLDGVVECGPRATQSN